MDRLGFGVDSEAFPLLSLEINQRRRRGKNLNERIDERLMVPKQPMTPVWFQCFFGLKGKVNRSPFSFPSSLKSLWINVIRRLLSKPYRKSNDFNTAMRIETSLVCNELDMIRRPRTEVGERDTVSVFPWVFNCGFL